MTWTSSDYYRSPSPIADLLEDDEMHALKIIQPDGERTAKTTALAESAAEVFGKFAGSAFSGVMAALLDEADKRNNAAADERLAQILESRDRAWMEQFAISQTALLERVDRANERPINVVVEAAEPAVVNVPPTVVNVTLGEDATEALLMLADAMQKQKAPIVNVAPSIEATLHVPKRQIDFKDAAGNKITGTIKTTGE